jgi:uncharacterized protein (DUF2237 family)
LANLVDESLLGPFSRLYTSDMKKQILNVFNEPLTLCCHHPKTGYFRDGFCRTNEQDWGRHTVCARVTREFLDFSRSRGNDLITPRSEFQFPGLKPGDRWCLCALRWLEAYQNRCAPLIDLKATHLKTLELIPLEILMTHSIENLH